MPEREVPEGAYSRDTPTTHRRRKPDYNAYQSASLSLRFPFGNIRIIILVQPL